MVSSPGSNDHKMPSGESASTATDSANHGTKSVTLFYIHGKEGFQLESTPIHHGVNCALHPGSALVVILLVKVLQSDAGIPVALPGSGCWMPVCDVRNANHALFVIFMVSNLGRHIVQTCSLHADAGMLAYHSQ